MTPAELAEWIPLVPWLVAVVVIAAAGTWAVKRLGPPLRKFGHLIDDLVGEPERPGVSARPGLMERMEAVEGGLRDQGVTLALVKHEVLPNTGTSMNDSVRRTEAHASKVEAKVDAALAWQRKHEKKSDEITARVADLEKEKKHGIESDSR